MPVTVKWGRERFSFDLPPPDTTLAAVRLSIAQYTHLPEHDFKLIHKGVIMKDDNAPISTYHLHPNSVIALIGSNEPLPAPAHAPPQPQQSQQATISTIQSELSAVRSQLTPVVELFLTNLGDGDLQPPVTDTQRKEHTRLGELLLQSLLRLDAVTPDSQWEEARRERKDAVREVQALLDRLDAAWATRST
ncbi:hypothetical protein BDN72DRAFT_834211 [Pluteus cervinus]|uniref:Uncharacterized protein n=1 Tax=Pluteus cervinus TaxID=181527 RepID=A0ACD3B8C7_9AGAR|nr:hypothetical protein BDN72DRAFT_834211 [Pluteus cervinus]